EVAELAGDRRERRRRYEVRRRDPREIVEAVQVSDDARQRRADDRLVEGGEEEGQPHTDRRENPGVPSHLSGHLQSHWSWLRGRREGPRALSAAALVCRGEGSRARRRHTVS